MKISYNWLCSYLPTELSTTPEEIAELLTDSGLEVEGLEKIESVKGGLAGLVIGEVLEKTKHPDADKLSVTRVDVGQPESLQIVCGAANVAAGQKVVVALVGATLYPSTGEPFTIKKSKIRGVESQGMICAEDEIGLGQDHSGIMVLDPKATIGSEAKHYFELEDDYLLELNLTPNRADAMSHFGVARDLLAVYNIRKGTAYRLPRNESTPLEVGSQSGPIEVIVEDTERCPRYAGIYISQVQVKPSPEWLQKRLRTIGVRPINNIVDITNYICHGLGQPLHAFDADKITGNTICVRTFDESTVFTTLDEVERKLHADDLMIADRENPLCLAGVFGGKESGVSEQTRHIFLESAYFNPVSVRKTAKRHGLSTDSSFRFERGIDPNQTLHALQIAAQMICDLAGGKADAHCIDIQAQAFPHHEVTFDLTRASVLIGEKLSNARVEQIFEQLEIRVQSVENGVYQLLVPPYRVDVQRECDIVEEILRIISFNAIEIPVKTAFSVSTQRNPEPEKYYNTAAQWLSSRGFSEALNNSLTKAVYAEWTNSETIHAQAGVEVLNPLSSELNALRQTLFFGGMENLAFNVNRRNNDLRIYEFGRTYQNKNGKFAESHQLGIWMSGSESPELWRQKSQEVDFFSLKETALALLQRLGIGEGLKMAESDAPWFVRSMSIAKNGQTLCHLGEVRQDWNQRFDIKQTVYYAEFNWDALLKWAGQAIVKYKPLNKFPSVRRDLSLLVDRSIKFADIENLAFKTERKLLQEVSLFDVYEGKNLPADKKSYAVSLILADTEKTLTDSVIENTMSRITAALAKELAAQLRM